MDDYVRWEKRCRQIQSGASVSATSKSTMQSKRYFSTTTRNAAGFSGGPPEFHPRGALMQSGKAFCGLTSPHFKLWEQKKTSVVRNTATECWTAEASQNGKEFHPQSLFDICKCICAFIGAFIRDTPVSISFVHGFDVNKIGKKNFSALTRSQGYENRSGFYSLSLFRFGIRPVG